MRAPKDYVTVRFKGYTTRTGRYDENSNSYIEIEEFNSLYPLTPNQVTIDGKELIKQTTTNLIARIPRSEIEKYLVIDTEE